MQHPCLLRVIASGLLVASMAHSGRGQDRRKPPPPAADAKVEAAAELVSLLTSDSFISRDWAAAELSHQGAAGIAALLDATRTSDLTRSREAFAALCQLAVDPEAPLTVEARAALMVLQDDEEVPVVRREAAADAVRRSVRTSHAQLRALGATFTRDRSGEITGVQVNSREFVDAHAKLLLRLPAFGLLDLRNSGISGACLADLAQLTSLTSLNISDTGVAGRDLHQLVPLNRLERLAIYRIPVDAEELIRLSRSLPGCRIHR